MFARLFIQPYSQVRIGKDLQITYKFQGWEGLLLRIIKVIIIFLSFQHPHLKNVGIFALSETQTLEATGVRIPGTQYFLHLSMSQAS